MGGQCLSELITCCSGSHVTFWCIVKSMLEKVLAIGLAAASMLLIILLQTTTPTTIGPLGILIVFILMYVSVLCALTFLVFAASRLVVRVSSSFGARRPLGQISFVKSYYYSSVLALAPVMLVGMQSVGVVGVYEVLLIVVFTLISCIYIAKRTA